MKTYLGKINQILEETRGDELEYAVGNSRSYADVTIWYLLCKWLPADVNDTTKASDKCETLNAIKDAVSTDPRVIKRLAERPVTVFWWFRTHCSCISLMNYFCCNFEVAKIQPFVNFGRFYFFVCEGWFYIYVTICSFRARCWFQSHYVYERSPPKYRGSK